MSRPLFVYERNKEIAVADIEYAKHFDKDSSWTHIASIEPKSYIKHLLTTYPDLVRLLKEVNHE